MLICGIYYDSSSSCCFGYNCNYPILFLEVLFSAFLYDIDLDLDDYWPGQHEVILTVMKTVD